MSDEEVIVLGGWNSKTLCYIDNRKQNQFEKIMNLKTQNTFNISCIQYIEPLKLLLVGDCFSDLSIFRY